MGRNTSRTRRNSVLVENLENRQLLSAVSVALEEQGFAKMTWQGQEVYVQPGQWIVQIADVAGTPKGQLDKANRMIGAIRNDLKVTRQLGRDGMFLLEAPRGLGYGALQKSLAGMGSLRSLEPDFALWNASTMANDPSFASQWALNNTGQTGGLADADIDAAEAWDISSGDGSVVVAVIDSGINYGHADLASNVWHNPGEIAGNGIDDDGNGYLDDVYGWDFYNNDNDPMDDNGHGTHVAGTIAAAGNNSIGVSGVAWNTKVMALKFLGADGTGTTSAAIAAINYATRMRTMYGINVRVTNNSWTGGAFSTTMYNAIKSGGDAGILFVAAAGNGGADQVGDDNDAMPDYPSSYNLDCIVSVAATDSSDRLASFSNYGASSVDLAAPGVSILSTTRNGAYGAMNGTSMAAPHVAGVAALAWSLAPDASYALVRQGLLGGVDAVPTLAGKTATGGRLNAYGALHYLQVALAAPVAPTGLAATAISSSRVDLAWTDASANEAGFAILRSADGVNFSQIATVGADQTQYSDLSVAAGTSYWYVVRAYNNGGASPDSNVATVTTSTVPTAPAAPTNLGAQPISTTQIKLTWTDASGNEDGFRIEKSSNGSKWSLLINVSANTTSYTHSGLRKGTLSYYRVRAYNAVGDSAYSNVASARTLTSGVTVAKTASASLFSDTPIASAADELLLDDAGQALA